MSRAAHARRLTPREAARRINRRLAVACAIIFVGAVLLVTLARIWGWWAIAVEVVGMLGLWGWQGWADARDRARVDWAAR